MIDAAQHSVDKHDSFDLSEMSKEKPDSTPKKRVFVSTSPELPCIPPRASNRASDMRDAV